MGSHAFAEKPSRIATFSYADPAGSTNIDMAASYDGRYLYTLNSATGTIGMFSVQDDGGLVNLGQQDPNLFISSLQRINTGLSRSSQC